MSQRRHTPPGLPVVGNAPRLASDPLRFLVGAQEAYGGQYPLVRIDPPSGQAMNVVTDAELVHEILADRDRFCRPAASSQQQRRQGLLSSDRALWEQQRSVLEPEFVGGRLAEYADIAADSADGMLEDWPEEGTVDLLEEVSLLTMRVITRALFSRDTTREQGLRVQSALETVAREFEPSVLDFLLPDRLQPGPSEAFEEADEVLDDVAAEYVQWHREQDDPPRDMITALMAAQRDPEIDLAENELIDETVLFMTAGQETTALTIAYAFYWLSQRPESRQRVREEALDVLGGEPPGWGDLSDLKYTERVVRETLRLTPAAWNVTRETRRPVSLADTEIAADEALLMPIYAHHRDSRVWGDPDTFRPDRWDGEVSRSNDSYFPFGSGPRVCIGRQIALTEAQFTLAHVLQHYEVEVLTEELDLQTGVTLRPGNPIRARVTARD